MSGQNKGDDAGCFGIVVGILIVFAIVVAVLSTIGHVLGLTPSLSEVTEKPDGWVNRHYEGVVVGYGLTILLLVLVAAVVLLALQSASDDPNVAAQGQTWIRRVGPALTICVLAVIILPIGKKPNAEGNVPRVVGMNASQAEDAVENASLSAEFERVPRDDEDCKVTRQEPRGGSDVDEYTDIRMRCVVAVPAVVGRKADTAEGRLQDAGFQSALVNEPSDYDTSRCRVTRQSRSEPSPPDAKVWLRLKCKKPKPEPAAETEPVSDCDENYTGGCVPTDQGEVDCADVSGPLAVTGTDVYGLDGNEDGEACE